MGAACPKLTTDLDCEEALACILPFFAEMQAIFVSEAKLERAAGTKLYCAPWVHDTERHFAACRDDGTAIVVAPELVELPVGTAVAILAHELGHATDFLYPAEFALDSSGSAQRRERDVVGDVQWARWVKAWEQRDADLVERTADALAELATGSRIGYLGPCRLQAFNRGMARPQGLR